MHISIPGVVLVATVAIGGILRTGQQPLHNTRRSEHNRSHFIVKRIFKEEFVVIKRDPSKVQFIARLNDFYFQFQKLGNNCVPVKAI